MAIYKEDIVDINLETGNIHRSFLNHSIGMTDSSADRFGVRLFRNGTPVDASGCSCYGYFRNSHGENIALTAHGTVDGNMAYVTLPQACYNYEGQFCLSIKLIGDGVTGTMRIVDGIVDNTNTGSAIAPTETVPTYTEILALYDEMLAATEEATEGIAPAFAQGTSNKAGSFVTNDGMFMLPNGHTAGDTWAQTAKRETTFGEDIADVKALVGVAGQTYGNGYDEFLQYSFRMENYILNDEDVAVTDLSNWNASPIRLSTRFPFSYSEDKVFRCDSGYKFKVAEVDSSTYKIVSWPSDWSTSYIIQSGRKYIVSLAHANTEENIYTDEAAHLFIDSFRYNTDQRINENQYRMVNVFNDDDYGIDLMGQFMENAKLCRLVGSVGDSIYSDSFYSKSYIRISLYKTLLHFENDTVIKSDSSDYLIALYECDSDGKLLTESASYRQVVCARGGRYYAFTMTRANDNLLIESDFSHIKATALQREFLAHNSYLTNENPFMPYYNKFIFSGIDYDSVHQYKLNFSYGSMGVRRSCFFKLEKPILLSMRNPDYVFRFYWYDSSNVYHENAWARLWETPVNVEVGMSIKRADGEDFASDERPELFLETWKADEEPKEYFQSEIEDTVNKVNAAFTEPGLCFLLSTDHHTMPTQNTGSVLKFDTISDMVTNMKAVAKRIHIDGHIALGDITDMKVGTSSDFEKYGITDTSYSNLDALFTKWAIDALEKLQTVHPNFYYTPGNHDDNRYINRDKVHASESAYDYTPGEVFAYYNAKGDHDVVYNMDNNGLDYYVDFSQFKIRMFFIDANYYNATAQTSGYSYTKAWWYGFADATVTWLQEQLASVPSDWSVIVCSHMSPIKEHNEDNSAYLNFANVKNAIQSFISGGGNYIATIYGHTHGDWSATSPWLEIGCACQKCENYNITIENMPGIVWPTRTAGTYTEDSWNVVLILPKSRKIKVIRFGAGSDREFSY